MLGAQASQLCDNAKNAQQGTKETPVNETEGET